MKKNDIYSNNQIAKISFFGISLITSSLANAHYQYIQDYLCGHQLAMQAAIATGGNFGIGLVDFTQTTEVGFSISGKINDAPLETKTVTPVLFAGLRNSLTEHTYFAWGLEGNKTFGTINGSHIKSNYQVALYISLEQMLNNHVMLVGWINPYQYEYQKLADIGVSTNQFFSTGGLGINYLF